MFGRSCPSWVGVRAQQDILEEIPHVLLRNSWEEGLVDWWVGVVHSFRKHLWRPPCRALCAHGVCMALSPCPQEFTVQGGRWVVTALRGRCLSAGMFRDVVGTGGADQEGFPEEGGRHRRDWERREQVSRGQEAANWSWGRGQVRH